MTQSQRIKKKSLYKELIEQSLQEIVLENVEDFSELKLSVKKTLISLFGAAIQPKGTIVSYDVSFYESIVEVYTSLTPNLTQGNNEKILLQFLQLCESEDIINPDQAEELYNQFDILKRLRRFHAKQRETPNNNFERNLRFCFQEMNNPTKEELFKAYKKLIGKLRFKLEDEANYLRAFEVGISDDSNTIDQFDRDLLTLYETSKLKKPKYDQLMQEVNFVRNMVQEMNLSELLGLDYVSVEPYGSTVSGFGSDGSDVDVSINTNCYLKVEEFLNLIQGFFKNYCEKNNEEVPVMKIIKAATMLLEYNRKDANLDICVNNILGCVNSRMLRTICNIHPLVKQLGVVIKSFAKRTQISSKDDLSSYSCILLMINYLLDENIIGDTFRKLRREKKGNREKETKILRVKKEQTEDFSVNLYFSSEEELKQGLAKFEQANPDKKTIKDFTLAELFIGFIEYYNNPSHKCISLDGNREIKGSNDEYHFNIEDPFDLKHNPGNKTKKKSTKYEDVFTRTRNFIQNKQFSKVIPQK